MGELNITFGGFCTSVYDLVPGIPMRTVLPDAMAIRFGVVRVPGQGGQYHDDFYFLMPHVPMLRDKAFGASVRRVLPGVYIKILNAKDQPLSVKHGGFHLTEFQKDVRPSRPIVYEGEAMAYFDIFGGRVWTEGRGDEPRVTRVNVKTHGTPRISLTPLRQTILPIEPEVLELNELFVTNLDVEAATEDTHFDFLGNFLVTEGGLPKVLDKRTPGMPAEPTALTLEHLGERLKALGLLVETAGTVAGWRAAIARGDEPGQAIAVANLSDSLFGVLLGGGTVFKGGIDPVPLNQSCSPSNLP